MGKFTDEPESELTRLCETMVETLEGQPNYDRDRHIVIALVADGEDLGIHVRAGRPLDAAKILLSAASTIFEETGGHMIVAPMGDFGLGDFDEPENLPNGLMARMKAAQIRRRSGGRD